LRNRQSIALELARRGASVAIVYANPKNGNRALETIEEIKAAGMGMKGAGVKGAEVKAVAILADLKDPIVGERIVKEALERLDVRKVHILGEGCRPVFFMMLFFGTVAGVQGIGCFVSHLLILASEN
jgi:NAD(P)-dependent dehydrogenase (short-subunit alcohol dehydrogenase family)